MSSVPARADEDKSDAPATLTASKTPDAVRALQRAAHEAAAFVNSSVAGRVIVLDDQGEKVVELAVPPLDQIPEPEIAPADTGGWSFATGPVADVDAVVRAYGVGAVRAPSGEIEHTLATFLIDADGNIAKRYLGTSHAPEAIRADIEALL